MIFLDHDHSFDSKTQVLESCSNGGLFSNFYHALWSLIDLHNQGLFTKEITFYGGNKMFREDHIVDLYPLLFEVNKQNIETWKNKRVNLGALPRLDHHGVYALYPYKAITPIIDAYFQPSMQVQSIVQSLNEKYQLLEKPYVALYYRGTDKHTEVTLAKLPKVIEATKRQMAISGVSRCLVQTDDAQILATILKNIPNAFYLDELPVANGDAGFHFQNSEKQVIKPVLFAQRLLAMTHIIAQAEKITLPVSNLAGWICLLRGTSDGIAQFNKHGQLVSAAYRRAFQLKNSLRKTRNKISGTPYYYV